MIDKKWWTRSFLAAALVATALPSAVTPAAAAGKTRWVDDDGKAGPSGCSSSARAPRSIQAAITASRSGDTIIVCPGTYVGSLTISGKTGLTLRASSAYRAVIIPSKDTDPTHAAIRIKKSSGIDLRWLRITIPSDTKGSRCQYYLNGVKATGSKDITIRSNQMYGTGRNTLDCGLEGGVFLRHVTGARVAYNVVRDPVAYGLWLESSDGVISRNSLRWYHPNDAAGGQDGTFGILAQDGDFTISDNIVHGGVAATPLRHRLDDGIVGYGGWFDVARNSIDHVGTGIDVSHVRDASDGAHSRVRGNKLVAGSAKGLRVRASVRVDVRDNTVSQFDGTGIAVSGTRGGVFGANRLRNVDVDGDIGCTDDSSGGGTAGTDNTWTDNTGAGSDPVGICTP